MVGVQLPQNPAYIGNIRLRYPTHAATSNAPLPENRATTNAWEALSRDACIDPPGFAGPFHVKHPARMAASHQHSFTSPGIAHRSPTWTIDSPLSNTALSASPRMSAVLSSPFAAYPGPNRRGTAGCLWRSGFRAAPENAGPKSGNSGLSRRAPIAQGSVRRIFRNTEADPGRRIEPSATLLGNDRVVVEHQRGVRVSRGQCFT